LTALICACAGFLLAVLWFDLMFDVQALGHRRSADLPAESLSSIAGYYQRVTTAAAPMNRLVGAVMLTLLAAIVAQLAEGDGAAWVGWLSLALAGGAIGLAAVHTFPAAVRLGSERDAAAERSRLARSILRDHLLCIGAVSTLLAIQLIAGG
jgi:hypothetical protein